MNKEDITHIAGLIAHTFLTSLINHETLNKLQESYPQSEKLLLLQEWFALQQFLMLVSISDYYKDRPEGIEIAKIVRNYIVEGLVESGLYETEEVATKLIKERFNLYNKSLNKGDNFVLQLSLQFLKYIGSSNPDILMSTGENIGVFLNANKRLIKDINSASN